MEAVGKTGTTVKAEGSATRTRAVRQRYNRKEVLTGLIFLAPSLVLFTAWIFYPLGRSVYLSFHGSDIFGRPSLFVGLSQYQQLFTSPTLRETIARTMIFTIITVVPGLVIGTLLALALQARIKGIGVFRTLLATPFAFSVATASVIFQIFFNPGVGVFNALLNLFHIHPVGWLTNPSTALASVALATVWLQLGYNVLVLSAGLQGIPEEIYEAARLDGARGLTLTRRVTLPLLTQKFIDEDKFNTDLEPNIASYFSIDKKLYSMPWNNSMPLLYYNKDAFTAAGLDPNKPPQTLDEIRDAATKLTKKDASGQVTQYGFGAAIYGWFLEQFAARADVQLCNNGNGRDKNATKLLANGAQEIKVLTWWSQMLKDGLALNAGRPVANMQTAFKAGRVAITLESTGALGGFISGSKFQVGTGFYPRSESTTAGGPIVGGASLWITNSKPEYEQRAAWEFTKFLETPENMGYWHTKTGYFPDTKASQSDPAVVAFIQTRPQFATALTQLHNEKPDKATQGCILGVMPQARQEVENGMEKALTGGASPQSAMDAAVAAIQPAIDQYNQAVGAK